MSADVPAAPLPPSPASLGDGEAPEPVPCPENALATPSRESADADADISRNVARVRRVALLEILLAQGRPLDGRELRWLARHNPVISPWKLKDDLSALVGLGLVVRRSGFGRLPDYSPSVGARRSLRVGRHSGRTRG